MKKRIWELDVLRGICLLVMTVIHFVYDISVLFPLVQWQVPGWYSWLVRKKIPVDLPASSAGAGSGGCCSICCIR